MVDDSGHSGRHRVIVAPGIEYNHLRAEVPKEKRIAGVVIAVVVGLQYRDLSTHFANLRLEVPFRGI
jgi:hypothetical protein